MLSVAPNRHNIPIFKVPFVAQQIIFMFAGIEEILTFCKCSKRARQLIKTMSLTLDHIHIDLTLGGYAVRCYRSGSHLPASIQLHNPPIVRRENKTLVVLNGARVWKENDGDAYHVTGATKDWLMAVLEGFVKKMLGYFRCFNYSLEVQNGKHFETMFIWKYCQRAFVSCRLIGGLPLEWEDLKFLMGNHRQVADLQIRQKVAEGIVYPDQLITKSLLIHDPHWIPFDSILDTRSTRLTLSEAPLYTAVQLTSIVRKWLDGGLRELKAMQIFYKAPYNCTRDAVLKAIGDHVVDMSHLEPQCMSDDDHNDEECSCSPSPTDVQREDGAIASVVLEKYKFALFVWK